MAKIVFYTHLKRKSLLKSIEFYRQDIDALSDLGHEVVICTKYREIPKKFDILFIWWWTYALIPIIISKVLNRPSIITGTFNFHIPSTYAKRDYFTRPSWQKLLIKLALKLCSANLFVSYHEFIDCCKYFKLANAFYFPHIVDNAYLQGPSKDRKIAICNISLSSKGNLIRKGIPELLEAIKLLKTQSINIHAKLAGHSGDGIEYLTSMIRKFDIADNICYLGEIEKKEKIDLLRSCEVYVQPSHYEGFGLAIAEAMGCGACIITCDVGEIRNVVGNAGLYVKPGSPFAIAEAIKLVLYDNHVRHRFQKLAYDRALKHFSYSTKLSRLSAILSQLV